ncbi:sensor domain-containing phosphodiesterase [Herbaspirillum sp. LeCh32-8]|uniref:sensor domain-containing phosphodiesterase n=1 Tax=Herbaspirillum sp. LeCh32-8 TaxID=2821356 RepID=UPI001AE32D2B|nr:sensor domain-containing phosphodiesterase [Herbaspirillum sp. LeCh32-8]MBP0598952.1 sensor domain-containing phosphodiesterase [Herbaspirillum sp. LeCh32-8]
MAEAQAGAIDQTVQDELQRLAALHSLHLLDTGASEDLDNITRLCGGIFDVSGAYVSLIDADRQWLKSQHGPNMCAPTREQSFCHYTVARRAVMVVEDAAADPRFAANPMVTGAPYIRFYAGAPLLTPDGHAIGALCITATQPRSFAPAQRKQLQQLAALAMSQMLLRRAVGRVDVLTGMPNKYQLQEDLEALARPRADGEEASDEARTLAYIDMPDAHTAFEIASVLGTRVYDDLVRNVGARLQQMSAGSADVYHVTDARFALLSHAGQEADFAQTLRAMTPALEQPVHSMTLPLNLPSYGGIVRVAPQREALLDAPRKAVAALHEAFTHQRRWADYDAEADVRHQRSFRLLNDIPDAIGAGQGFQLAYQPKLDLKRGAYHGGEALLRWQHRELGAISPAEFIPLVERTALIRPVSDWVITAALKQMAAWRKEGMHLKLAINLSAPNFDEGDIVQRLEHACREADIDPAMVEIECTEGLWMQSPSVLKMLHAIRALGMGLALDDFGTGYSNFAYLQQVPASVVKIDQSLIRNLDASARDRRIVQSLIALAKELDYRIVAEGVETAQTLQLIRDWGVDEAQGYYLARPLAPDAFASHVRSAATTILQ